MEDTIQHAVLLIVVFITGLLTTAVGWYGSQKFHIGPMQDALVKTMENVIDTQGKRIEQLEELTIDQKDRIRELEDRVKELERIVLGQAQEISSLKSGAG